VRYTTTASCLASGPPRHPPNSLPVSVVQARLICERPQAELSCKSAHASQARTLFSQMIIYRFYPAHASCPFSDLPLPTRGLAPADDGLQGIVRRAALRTNAPIAPLEGLDGSGCFLPPRPLRPHVVKAGSRVSHLHNHRLQGTSLTAIFCSLLRPFSTCSPGFAAKFWPSSCLSHQANVPSSSKSCAVQRLRSLSIVFRPLRLGATLNLLCHGYLRSHIIRSNCHAY